MRATRGNAIVSVRTEQKSKHGILFMMKQMSIDSKESNNVVCTVLDINSEDYPYLKTGDTLLVHHNFFAKDSGYFLDKSDGEAIFVIPVKKSDESSHIYAKVVDGELEAVCDNILVSRIMIPLPETILVIPDSARKNYTDRVLVISKAPEVNGINVGDTVFIKEYADAELIYNIDGREQRVCKCWQEDILGIIKN